MDRLKGRNLGRKRSLALREFALDIESSERFVRKEPLRYVHECVFGVLALESEPVDPRLYVRTCKSFRLKLQNLEISNCKTLKSIQTENCKSSSFKLQNLV